MLVGAQVLNHQGNTILILLLLNFKIMPFTLEVKYYNTFWLKQNTTPFLTTTWADSPTPPPPATFPLRPSYVKLFPGIPFLNKADNNFPNWPQQVPIITPQVPPLIPGAETVPYSNVYNTNNSTYLPDYGSNWVIEESRIRGGYNNTQVDFGVRAYLMEESSAVRPVSYTHLTLPTTPYV